MPTIRIENEVFEGLKKLAEPFVDTPNAVIRRLLIEKGLLKESLAKASSLPAEDKSELDHYLEIEHLMRLAKARARHLLAHGQ